MIGIIVGFIVVGIIIVVVGSIYSWKKVRDFDKQMEVSEMQSVNKWNKNQSHEQKTKWNDYNAKCILIKSKVKNNFNKQILK